MSDETSLDVRSMRQRSIAIWPAVFGEWVSKIEPAIYCMPEDELESKFRVTEIDYFLRKKFWELSVRHMESGKVDAELSEIYDGLCIKQHFYGNVLRNPYRLSWLLIPLQPTEAKIEHGFHVAMKRAMDILNMPLTEKTAGPMTKIIEFFANRHIGPLLQKIQQTSMNVNVDGNKAMKEAYSPDKFDEKLKELKSRIVSLPEAATNVQEPE